MRRIDREVTDLTEILKIIDAAKILHLGMMEQEYPYVVPMHFGYEYAGNQLVFYLHCAKEGHKLDVMQENPHVCVELETNVELEMFPANMALPLLLCLEEEKPNW